jgi:hypothetical protein
MASRSTSCHDPFSTNYRYARTVGTRGTPSDYSMQRLVIMGGKITTLNLTLYYLE